MKLPFFSEPPSRAQRLGLLVLMFLIAGLSLYQAYLKRRVIPPDPAFAQLVWDSSLVAIVPEHQVPDSIQLSPFPFNPNTVSDTQLRQMGLRAKVVRMWTNYRNKGGYFYSKEQVQRLYCMTDTEYQQLAPFIQLPDRKSDHQKTLRIIELNQADTAQLNTLPGIGAKRAEAIVAYRKRLGGFYQPSQLLEIPMIDAKTFQNIKPWVRVNKKQIQTLPLLAVTWNEFKQHPYFQGELGRAILRFRKEKNYTLQSLEELKEINEVNDEIFRKIVPYLRLE